MRKLMFLAAVIGLMVLVLAASFQPAGLGVAITTEGAEATFGGTLQEPAITTSTMPPR